MTLLAPPSADILEDLHPQLQHSEPNHQIGVQMTWLRPAFAMLIAVFGSTADAGPQAVPRKYQAGFYLDGCKDFLAGRSNFLSGRCVGAVEVLNELGSDNKSFCPPETLNNIDQVRVIVTYIEGLPKRLTDGFGLLANEAMAKAWPCKT
jgi:Rap1a immunity proteins